MPNFWKTEENSLFYKLLFEQKKLSNTFYLEEVLYLLKYKDRYNRSLTF